MNIDYKKIIEELQNIIELQRSNDYSHVKEQMTVNMLKRVLETLATN